MELQVNPSIDDLKLILWLAGGLIMVMIAVISYFIRQQFEASKALTEAVATLNVSVNALKIQIELQMPLTERRLNSHAVEISDLKDRMKEIETEHNLFKKNCKR